MVKSYRILQNGNFTSSGANFSSSINGFARNAPDRVESVLSGNSAEMGGVETKTAGVTKCRQREDVYL